MRTLTSVTVVSSFLVLLGATGAVAAVERTSGNAAALATLTVRNSDYGRIVFDSRGRALYAFTRDPRGRSVCSGACATAWPPYLVRGKLRAPAGVNRSLLGTTRRADGTRQLTFGGLPLYYYVGDRKPGEVRCQNIFEFGGLWLVVRPSGRLVRGS
jgi:predicted lipoprotein with Yx(FWY)xxD motif